MDLFVFNIPEWIFVIVNLLILMFVLSKILWKPVNKILDERQERLDKAIADAAAAEADRKIIAERLAALQDDLDRQTMEQMKEARSRAGREYDRIVAEAGNRAAQIISAANIQSERERESMLNAAKAEIVSSTLAMTSFLLESNMDSAQNERLLEAFLERKDVSA